MISRFGHCRFRIAAFNPPAGHLQGNLKGASLARRPLTQRTLPLGVPSVLCHVTNAETPHRLSGLTSEESAPPAREEGAL